MGKQDKGRISFGTLFMLLVTLGVLGGLTYVIPKLSSDAKVDLNRVQMGVDEILSLIQKTPDHGTEDIPLQQTAIDRKDSTTTQPAATATPVPVKGGTFTVTFGGTVAVEDGVRKSAYLSDSKSYDFSEPLALLKGQIDSDLNLVFFENLLLDDQKVSNLVIPGNGGAILKGAGFDTVCMGFSKVLDKGSEGMKDSVVALNDLGLNVVGAYGEKNTAGGILRNLNGVKVAVLQFTASLSATGQKHLKRNGETWSVPSTDESVISHAIQNVRNAGADVVIVCLQWGAEGNKTPTKKQQTLAQQIAEAGADIIVGTGSRITQSAEYLTVTDEAGRSRSVLCAWSLGTLLAENRNNNRTAGMLLQLTVENDGEGHTGIRKAEYIPTWIWQYKQDGVTYYRTVAADRDLPDGLTESEKKAADKATGMIDSVMAGSPISKKEP